MKKNVFLLAASLSMLASSAWATDDATSSSTKNVTVASTPTAASELQGGGYFVIKVTTKGDATNPSGGYVYYNGNSSITSATGGCFRVYKSALSTDTIGNGGSLAYVWRVTKLSDNKLVIQNAGNGAFFPAQNGHAGNMAQVKTISNVAYYNYSSPYDDKGVLLYQDYKIDNKNIYIHANDGDTYPLSYWEGAANPGTGGSACLFTFYKAELSDAVTSAAYPVAKATVKINGVETNSYTALFKEGTTPYHYLSCVYDGNLTHDETNNVYTVNFTYTAATPAKYFRLKVRGAGEKWVLPTSDGNQLATNSTLTNNFTSYNSSIYWCLEPTSENYKVKLRNGNGKYVNVSGTGAAATLSDEGTVFTIKGAPSNASNSNFSLQYADNCYLGDHLGYDYQQGSNTRIGTWSNNGAANDAGSGYTINDVATSIVESLKAELISRLSSTTQPTTLANNVLRVASANQIAQATEAANAATDIAGIMTAYNIAYAPKVETTAYYRIKNVADINNKYISSEDIFVGKDGLLSTAYNADKSTNRTIARKKESDNLTAQLWQFDKQSDGTFYIRNANNDCHMANATSNIDMPISKSDGGIYSLLAIPTSSQKHIGNVSSKNDGVSTFQLMLNGNNSISATSGDIATTIGAYNNHDEADANYWQLIKVTEFPVAITSAKYATVGFPFNTKVTTEGVRVFYAKNAENGVMTLTEVEDKIIPAKQGAILYNENGATTAKLEITSETGTYENNCLTATTAGRKGYTAENTYGLALSDATNEACFKINSLETIPANKAFLNKENYSEAIGRAMELKFMFNGGSITGIGNATINNENADVKYYDLQGRRVLYPAHGIFVNSKGEKVLIK